MSEPHRWRKGVVTNPRGRPRKGTSLAERIRERVDPDELIDIAMGMARGEPMVRIIDRATGRPRLAEAPSRTAPNAKSPGEERPVLVSQVPEGEAIADIVWPTFGDRMKAVEWITTMGGMKPPAETIMSINRSDDDAGGIDFADMSPEMLDKYLDFVSALEAAAKAKDQPILDVVPEKAESDDE